MSLRSGLASSPGTTLDSVPPGCCGMLGRGDGGGGGAFSVLRTQSGRPERSILYNTMGTTGRPCTAVFVGWSKGKAVWWRESIEVRWLKG